MEVPTKSVNEQTERAKEEPTRRAWRSGSSAVAALTLLAAGLLFGVSASNADRKQDPLELDLVSVVTSEAETVETLDDEVNQLKAQRAALLLELGDESPSGTAALAQRQKVKGPGVVVMLDDAPIEFGLDSEVNPNDTVVHQQDVDAVMNALWVGGAEFMAVQDERITARTPVRCIGNVILVGANSYAPPYSISAVGNVEGMLAALDSDSVVRLYKQDAARYGLGWSVEVKSELELPAAQEPGELQYAKDN